MIVDVGSSKSHQRDWLWPREVSDSFAAADSVDVPKEPVEARNRGMRNHGNDFLPGWAEVVVLLLIAAADGNN